MSGGMYMINGGGALVAMKPTPFAKEEDFQKLLEKYPELLTGDQIDPTEPRRWVLVRREMGVPGTAESPGWLSLDHLYLDQGGIPTLVEVKRAENTEVRRKVVAQMLDYAANAVVYWPPEEMRIRFEERVASEGKNPDQELAERLGIDPDKTDEFWQKVTANLRSGNIRMLFVADVIPRELRRIVEFLNEQMSPAVVLAVELQQFTADTTGDIKTLVPRVFGQTERAIQEKKAGSYTPKPTVAEILDRLAGPLGEPIGTSIRELTEWAGIEGFNLRPTTKNLYFGFKNKEADIIEIFSLDTDGRIWAQFGESEKRYPFNVPEIMQQLRSRFTTIPDLQLTNKPSYPSASIKSLSSKSFSGLRDLLVWARQQI